MTLIEKELTTLGRWPREKNQAERQIAERMGHLCEGELTTAQEDLDNATIDGVMLGLAHPLVGLNSVALPALLLLAEYEPARWDGHLALDWVRLCEYLGSHAGLAFVALLGVALVSSFFTAVAMMYSGWWIGRSSEGGRR